MSSCGFTSQISPHDLACTFQFLNFVMCKRSIYICALDNFFYSQGLILNLETVYNKKFRDCLIDEELCLVSGVNCLRVYFSWELSNCLSVVCCQRWFGSEVDLKEDCRLWLAFSFIQIFCLGFAQGTSNCICRMLWTNKTWKSGPAVGMLEDAVGFLEKLKRNVQALEADSGSVTLKVQTFVIGLVCEFSWLRTEICFCSSNKKSGILHKYFELSRACMLIYILCNQVLRLSCLSGMLAMLEAHWNREVMTRDNDIFKGHLLILKMALVDFRSCLKSGRGTG